MNELHSKLSPINNFSEQPKQVFFKTNLYLWTVRLELPNNIQGLKSVLIKIEIQLIEI